MVHSPPSSTDTPIAIDRRGDVALVTLTNPPANALARPMLEALRDVAATLRSDDSRAVVLTGAGRFFSAGLDLFEVANMIGSPDGAALARCFDQAMTGLFSLDKPVVAAINGHAVAGGAVLAATADFRLVADGPFKLGLTEILVGVAFPTSALEIVRCSCAGRYLPELLYRGMTYGPADAVQRGLADEVVPAGALVDRAVALAAELGAHRPAAFTSSKRALRAEYLARMRAAGARGLDPRWQTWRSDEALEAIARFRDRTLGSGRGGE
jgi:enoyl-CoA hydratase